MALDTSRSVGLRGAGERKRRVRSWRQRLIVGKTTGLVCTLRSVICHKHLGVELVFHMNTGRVIMGRLSEGWALALLPCQAAAFVVGVVC